MQYGKFCAAAGIALDAEAAQHTIIAQNAFRMVSSVLTSSGIGASQPDSSHRSQSIHVRAQGLRELR
jgi:hypothetical protein